MGGAYSAAVLRGSIDGAIARIKLRVTAAKNQARKERGDIAGLLRRKQEEQAKIRAEALYQTDNRTEAMRILEQQLEVLKLRVDLLSSQPTCPQDLVATLATILYSVDRCSGITELQEIQKQLARKYPTKFLSEIVETSVNSRVVDALSFQPPSGAIVSRYLEQIAIAEGVEYSPPDASAASSSATSCADIPRAPASGLSQVYSSTEREQAPLVLPSPYPPPPTKVHMATVVSAQVPRVVVSSPNSEAAASLELREKADLDDIAARLAALRK